MFQESRKSFLWTNYRFVESRPPFFTSSLTNIDLNHDVFVPLVQKSLLDITEMRHDIQTRDEILLAKLEKVYGLV